MKYIFLIIQVTITLCALFGVFLNLPYSTKLNENQKIYIGKLDRFIETFIAENQRFPKLNEIDKWMEQQDSQGMHYNGNFVVKQNENNQYSITFNDDSGEYYKSTQKDMVTARIHHPNYRFSSFAVLLALSLLSFTIYLFPKVNTRQ